VPADSQNPPSFDHPPWHRCFPPPNHFLVPQEFFKGEVWKKWIKEITNSHHSKMDQVVIYCRSLGPNPTQMQPMWTAACVAFRQGQEVGHQATVLGQNALAREVAFHAVVDAAVLARNLLMNSLSPSITLLTANQYVIPYCQVTDHHDNTTTCRAICDTVLLILAMHPDTTLSIWWIPGKISFQPLERLQAITIEATAHVIPDLNLAAPSTEALQVLARHEALLEWEKVWLEDPCSNLAYQALHHPPTFKPPEFIRGIGSTPHPIFCTAVCLLMEHVFTGEYNA
jgi:hypothetical protein